MRVSSTSAFWCVHAETTTFPHKHCSFWFFTKFTLSLNFAWIPMTEHRDQWNHIIGNSSLGKRKVYQSKIFLKQMLVCFWSSCWSQQINRQRICREDLWGKADLETGEGTVLSVHGILEIACLHSQGLRLPFVTETFGSFWSHCLQVTRQWTFKIPTGSPQCLKIIS